MFARRDQLVRDVTAYKSGRAKDEALHRLLQGSCYIRCTACGANRPMAVKPNPASASRPETHASATMPVMIVAEASTMPIWNAAEATS